VIGVVDAREIANIGVYLERRVSRSKMCLEEGEILTGGIASGGFEA